jgi:prepilin signal peptidase PulO-like enzyme (type II secretory pathway)
MKLDAMAYSKLLEATTARQILSSCCQCTINYSLSNVIIIIVIIIIIIIIIRTTIIIITIIIITITTTTTTTTTTIIIIITPWSRVLPEKLKRPRLLKKFLAFYGTRRFITAFARARHLSLS